MTTRLDSCVGGHMCGTISGRCLGWNHLETSLLSIFIYLVCQYLFIYFKLYKAWCSAVQMSDVFIIFISELGHQGKLEGGSSRVVARFSTTPSMQHTTWCFVLHILANIGFILSFRDIWDYNTVPVLIVRGNIL